MFKKKGTEDEHDKALHNRLRGALLDPSYRLLNPKKS
jgi:hypothetical protein